MKITTLALPAGAAALAALLLTPNESVGYSTIGGKLGTENDRAVRVHNNFTDSQANNNTTADPDWPGYDGAELAIWKACSEWGSEPHNNNGNGDPLQPGGLGSGGANFDVTWQGNANSIGSSNDNIHSEISGSGGSTYAFTETPINDGWRIRYYEDPWTWNDGPNTGLTGFAGTDLQGIACHEFGHALGLGHSGNGSATMSASTSTSGSVFGRSINSDDQAGIQSIYQVLDLNKKAHVFGYTQSNGLLTITGTKFSLTPGANEVWFTKAGSNNQSLAVKATGLDSDGTTIVCAIPADAGPGDFVVRNQDIGGPKGMSNQMAIVPEVCDNTVVAYCTAGTSANGCTAAISGTGTPSSSAASGFTIDVTGVEGDKDGLLFFGENGRQANSWGSGTSFQCVVPPVKRTGLQDGVGTQGACDGTFSLDLNAYLAANPQKNPGLGATVNAQCWYRDPFNTGNQTTSLSDALEFTLCD